MRSKNGTKITTGRSGTAPIDSTPTRGAAAGCCARAASGHAAAAPPSSVMNSRRSSGRYRDHCQWDFLIGLSCFE
jgi:hypothetical protein